jgi:mono/diheme cytochrome c family protein
LRRNSTLHLILRGAASRRLALLIPLALLFSTPAFADSGADTYKAKCSACHGVRGMADTMLGRNLKLRSLASDDVQKDSDDALFNIISKGKNRMPSFNRKLSPEQIRDLVKHLRTLKK